MARAKACGVHHLDQRNSGHKHGTKDTAKIAYFDDGPFLIPPRSSGEQKCPYREVQKNKVIYELAEINLRIAGHAFQKLANELLEFMAKTVFIHKDIVSRIPSWSHCQDVRRRITSYALEGVQFGKHFPTNTLADVNHIHMFYKRNFRDFL